MRGLKKLSKKSPNSKAKLALKGAIDRLFTVCDAPLQRKPLWSVKPGRLIFQISSPTAKQALIEALALALQRHRGLFLQEPALKNTQVVFDGTPFSLTLIYALWAESLHLLLDEIDDLAKGQKPLLPKLFRSTLLRALKKHSAPRAMGESKWVQALDGILSEKEFALATQQGLERRALQRERELRKLFKRIKAQKNPSSKKLLLAAEIEHVWSQTKNLGSEAKETIWTSLIEPRINALKKRLS
jgi:hypothetical protein